MTVQTFAHHTSLHLHIQYVGKVTHPQELSSCISFLLKGCITLVPEQKEKEASTT